MILALRKEHSGSVEGWTAEGQIKMDTTHDSACTQVVVDEMDGLER